MAMRSGADVAQRASVAAVDSVTVAIAGRRLPPSSRAAAAQDRPADAVDALRGHLRTARAGAEQRRRAAGRHQSRGALQQRVPVGVPADERRADQPAGDGAAALARLGVHLSLRRRRPGRSCDRRAASARSWRIAPRRSAAARSRSATPISSSPTIGWTACALANIPAVFTHDNPEAGGGRTDVVATDNTIEATVTQFTGALTYGITDRIDLSLAVPVVRTRLSLLSNATIHRIGTGSNLGVHYFSDPDAIGGYGSTRQFFAEGLGRRRRRSGGARQGDDDARGVAGARRRASTSGCRPATSRTCSAPARSGVRPFVGVLRVDRRLRAARQRRLPVERQEPDRRRRPGEPEKADLPDQFIYALGADVLVAPRLSVVARSVRPACHQLAAADRSPQSTRTGVAGSVTLDDIQFVNESYWTSAGGFGLKANIAPQMLRDVQPALRDRPTAA